MITVYRYGNRKLYCPNERKFVKIEHIFQWRKEGKDLKVIDHKTKNDITEGFLNRAYIFAAYKKVYDERLI